MVVCVGWVVVRPSGSYRVVGVVVGTARWLGEWAGRMMVVQP